MHDKPVEVHSGRTRRRWLISAACGLVSILTFLFVLYQACSVKAFAESLNDARRAADSLAVGPDMSREKELALMGDSLLLIEGKLWWISKN